MYYKYNLIWIYLTVGLICVEYLINKITKTTKTNRRVEFSHKKDPSVVSRSE